MYGASTCPFRYQRKHQFKPLAGFAKLHANCAEAQHTSSSITTIPVTARVLDSMDDFPTISEAAKRIRTGEISPVELTRTCLDRIATLNDELHAFITVTGEQALEQARLAESEISAGAWRGPLHGIPIAHKDMVCTRGVRTTAHSNLLRDWIPESDATVHTRLTAAGAISLGKLALWEFASGLPGPNVAFPPARNPWNTEYSPAGSSSGSGTAVSAGLCLGATGTDTGGSIRFPAAACGIVGMKPTYGRVSVHGVLPLAPSLDHVGPMTRTVRDNALMLQAMAGYDPADPTSADEPVRNFQRLIGQDLRGFKIAIPRTYIDTTPHDGDCVEAFDRAIDVLVRLGVELVEFDFPSLYRAGDVTTRILLAEALGHHLPNLLGNPEAYDKPFRERLMQVTAPAPEEWDALKAERRELKREYARLFASGVDLIASPGRQGAAETMASLLAQAPARRNNCTRMYSLSGMPALVMPMGFSTSGLPFGIQFAASWFAEDRIYQVAAAYEAATGWTSRRPLLHITCSPKNHQ